MRAMSLALAILLSIGCGAKKEKKKSHDDDEPASTSSARSSADTAPSSKATSSAAPSAAASQEDPFVAKHLELLERAGSCKDGSSIKAFCALKKFPDAKAAPPPPRASSHIGLSTFVPTEGATEESIAQRIEVSALAFKPEGNGKAWLSGVKPDNDEERKELLATRAAIEAFANGGSKPNLSDKLATYLSSLSDTAKYPMTPHRRGFRLEGGSKADLRYVGNAWVAVEVPARDPKGMWISVYPN